MPHARRRPAAARVRELGTRAHGLAEAAQAVSHARRLLHERDTRSLDYFKGGGWTRALDLAAPGIGSAIADLITSGRSVREVAERERSGGVVEGSYRVVEDAPPERPWRRWAEGMRALDWGVVVVLGAKESGKSTVARELARRWAARLGYAVVGVNVFRDDALPGLEHVSVEQLGAEVGWVVKYLAGDLGVPPAFAADQFEALQGRVVIVDEASLAIGPGATDKGRRVVRQLVSVARHLRWIVVLVAQLAVHLPLDLLVADAILVREPVGTEMLLDRQEPFVKLLWTQANKAFGKELQTDGSVRQVAGEWQRSPWAARFPRPQSWLFAYSTSARAGGPYFGIAPVGPPDEAAA